MAGQQDRYQWHTFFFHPGEQIQAASGKHFDITDHNVYGFVFQQFFCILDIITGKDMMDPKFCPGNCILESFY